MNDLARARIEDPGGAHFGYQGGLFRLPENSAIIAEEVFNETFAKPSSLAQRPSFTANSNKFHT